MISHYTGSLLVPTAVETLQPDLPINQVQLEDLKPDLPINQVLLEDLKLTADILQKDQVEGPVRSILVEGEP